MSEGGFKRQTHFPVGDMPWKKKKWPTRELARDILLIWIAAMLTGLFVLELLKVV